MLALFYSTEHAYCYAYSLYIDSVYMNTRDIDSD